MGPDNLRPKLTPHMGPRPRPRRAVFQGHLMKAQDRGRGHGRGQSYARHLPKHPGKEANTVQGKGKRKVANTVIRDSAPDKPIPKAMPLCFFGKDPNHSRYGMTRQTCTPKKGNMNMWTQKGGGNTDIKGKGSKT